MPAAKLKIKKGTTYAITVRYLRNGVAESLAGATIYFTAKSTEYDDDAADSDASIKADVTEHTDAAGGISTIHLSPADTNIEPGTYHYDIRVKDADGDVYPLDEGLLEIDGSPTNRSLV